MRVLPGVVALCVLLGGCSTSGEETPEPTAATTTATGGTTTSTGRHPASRTGHSPAPSTPGTGSSSARTTDEAAPDLTRDLRRLVERHDEVELSVALAPVGGGEPDVVGEAPTLIAWSTSKVPLAMAVEEAGLGDEAAQDVDAAITASDNEAAARLWERLGSGEDASAATEAQLRRGGDDSTEVPPEVTVPGFSAFGQSRWALADQATFTAALPCLGGSDRVTDAMGRVVPGQSWGLGTIDGTRFKGGWGPTPEGYVVRQLGILPGTKGETAVTLQVRGGDHDLDTAVADEVADVLEEHPRDLPTGSC